MEIYETKHKVCFPFFYFFHKLFFFFGAPSTGTGTEVQGYQMTADDRASRGKVHAMFAGLRWAEAVSGPTSFLLAGKNLAITRYDAKFITNCLL
jgi:hypothetical protein